MVKRLQVAVYQVQFECEMSPAGSCVQTLGARLGVLGKNGIFWVEDLGLLRPSLPRGTVSLQIPSQSIEENDRNINPFRDPVLQNGS